MKKNDYCVIGLGRFGLATVDTLTRLKQNVIVVDSDKQRIDNISRKVSYAVSFDPTNIDLMRDAGIDKIDNVIVAISKDLESNLMTCSVLKKMGVKNIIARGLSDNHEQILRAIGISNIVRPEIRGGTEAALRSMYKVGVEISEISKNYSILKNEVRNTNWANKTIYDLNLREKYKINIILITRLDKTFFPEAEFKVQLGDKITFLIKNDEISDINKHFAISEKTGTFKIPSTKKPTDKTTTKK